jgi:hypothetical protein
MISHESDINYVQSCNLFNLYTVYNIVIKSVFIRLDLEKKWFLCTRLIFRVKTHCQQIVICGHHYWLWLLSPKRVVFLLLGSTWMQRRALFFVIVGWKGIGGAAKNFLSYEFVLQSMPFASCWYSHGNFFLWTPWELYL